VGSEGIVSIKALNQEYTWSVGKQYGILGSWSKVNEGEDRRSRGQRSMRWQTLRALKAILKEFEFILTEVGNHWRLKNISLSFLFLLLSLLLSASTLESYVSGKQLIPRIRQQRLGLRQKSKEVLEPRSYVH
jgi:hypothetical protein